MEAISRRQLSRKRRRRPAGRNGPIDSACSAVMSIRSRFVASSAISSHSLLSCLKKERFSGLSGALAKPRGLISFMEIEIYDRHYLDLYQGIALVCPILTSVRDSAVIGRRLGRVRPT